MPIPLLPEDRRVRQGAWLLVASLGVFFAASMILYCIYIFLLTQGVDVEEPLKLPASFLPSTLFLIGVSAALHMAGLAAQRDQRSRLLQSLSIAMVLAIAFFIVQGEGMWRLLQAVNRLKAQTQNAYAFTFLLAFVHAMHVVGGLVGLIWILVKAILGYYDHERNYGVRFCALYWHFLDGVWVVMLGGFIAASLLL